MRRFKRTRGGRTNSRKTRWTSYQVAATTIDYTNEACLTGWAKWPAGFQRPDNFGAPSSVEPSDETLVRTIMATTVLLDAAIPGAISPVEMCVGLIAFDGGNNPDVWDNGYFVSTDQFRPPWPIDGNEDWIIRQPFIFMAAGGFETPGTDLFLESKAKRKLPPGTGLLWVAQFLDIPNFPDGAGTFSVSSDVRMAVRSGYTV